MKLIRTDSLAEGWTSSQMDTKSYWVLNVKFPQTKNVKVPNSRINTEQDPLIFLTVIDEINKLSVKFPNICPTKYMPTHGLGQTKSIPIIPSPLCSGGFIRLVNSSELSAGQTIHVKFQTLFLQKLKHMKNENKMK